jgi:hypothetical protein
MATLASCSSKITEEQLAQLRDLRQREQTLNQQIRTRESERSRLQGEVSARRAEVDRCNTNKQFVQGKLQQWPNVWPDWADTVATTPATPPAPVKSGRR